MGEDSLAIEDRHTGQGEALAVFLALPAAVSNHQPRPPYHSHWSDRLDGQPIPHRERLGEKMREFPEWRIWQTEYCCGRWAITAVSCVLE